MIMQDESCEKDRRRNYQKDLDESRMGQRERQDFKEIARFDKRQRLSQLSRYDDTANRDNTSSASQVLEASLVAERPKQSKSCDKSRGSKL